MAKQPQPERKIKLPGGSGQASMAGRPPAQPQQRAQAQGAPTDDVGSAMANLDRNAQVRSKHDLPDRVKVITPQVIEGIVHSIIDKYVTDGVTADELAKLTSENTQMQLRMQQMQGRDQSSREELGRLQAYVDELQGMLDAHVQGRASADQNVQYYETQIRDLQQKNAQMVDLYADAQRQVEEAAQAAQENEAALDHTAGELVAARDALATAEEELEKTRSNVSQDGAEAEQFAEQLGADLEAQKASNAELQQRVEELEASLAERAENINQERTARERVERELDAANGRLTAIESESDKLKQNAGANQEAQAKIADLESEVLTLREKLVHNNENSSSGLRELQEKNRKLSDQVRDAAVKERKYEQIDAELEKLRQSEGKWLEERRNMAAQLSHETNLRRDVEQKLKAIEKGEVSPGGKALEDRLAQEKKKYDEELNQLTEKVRKAEKDAALAKQATELQASTQEKLLERDERIIKLEKELAAAKANAQVGGEQAKGEIGKSEEKIKRLNEQVRELSMVARKYENVAAELEALRQSEGKWLEEKRVMASQVTHEADLRKQLETKMQGLNLGDVVPKAKLDEADKELKQLRAEIDDLKKKLLSQEQVTSSSLQSANESKVNERSLALLEDENERLTRELDGQRARAESLEADLAGKNSDSKRVTLVQSELQRTRADLEIARGERDGAYADLNIIREDLARERREQTARFQAISAQLATMEQFKRERDEAQSARDELRLERDALKKSLEDRSSASGAETEKLRDHDKELAARLSARDLQLSVAQQQIKDLQAEVSLLEEARKDATVGRIQASKDLERRSSELDKVWKDVERLRERIKELESQTHEKIEIEKEVAARALSVIEGENEKLRNRLDELGAKRDELRVGLEQAMQEIKGLQEALAKAGHDERQVRSDRDALHEKLAAAEARLKELEAASSQLAPAAATAAQVARELELARNASAGLSEEIQALQGQLNESQQEADAAQAEAEKQRTARHENEVALAETRARLESEMQVRLERDRRITQLSAELAEEREQRLKSASAPTAAVESLNAAVEHERRLHEDRIAAERTTWTERHLADLEELERQRALAKEAELEVAALQDRLDELDGKSQEARQESIEAKRLSGQRRAQIERMQAEVERARDAEKRSEQFWKTEMKTFESMMQSHLEAAERKEDGADLRMVRVLEDLQVGVFDKYSKARKRLNKLEKESEAAHVKIQTLQKVIEAHTKQGQLLQQLKDQETNPEGIKTPKRTGRVRKKS